jgi:hypothetical protein
MLLRRRSAGFDTPIRREITARARGAQGSERNGRRVRARTTARGSVSGGEVRISLSSLHPCAPRALAVVFSSPDGRQRTEGAKYGITPDHEPTPLTVEQKAAKVAKAKATRAARHTLGPKQKKAITGATPQTPPAKGP